MADLHAIIQVDAVFVIDIDPQQHPAFTLADQLDSNQLITEQLNFCT